MGKVISLIEGLGIGALAMYFYDPDRGNSRRALVRDKVQSIYNAKLDAKDIMVNDTINRVKGLAHKTKARLSFHSPDDKQILEQIKSKIGHVVSHSGALAIDVNCGKVRVSGPILAEEQEQLIATIWDVQGVEMIEHKLDAYEDAGHIPALQGEVRHLTCDDWTPTVSMAMCVAGGLMALFGVARGGIIGKTVSAAGLGLVAKGFGDVEAKAMALQK